MNNVETNSVKRIVLHCWKYRPWNTVKWTYTESDDKGLVILKAENTTYLYKALLIAVFLSAANLIINLTLSLSHNKQGE